MSKQQWPTGGAGLKIPPNSGADAAADDIPSPKLGHLGAFARFAATDTFEATSERTYACDMGKPGKTDYFRAHPDQTMWQDFHLLEWVDPAGQRQLYFVDPSLSGLPELEGQVKRKKLVPYQTLRGNYGLWPIGVKISTTNTCPRLSVSVQRPGARGRVAGLVEIG